MSETQEEKNKKRKKIALQAKYNQRITIAKQGREYFLNKDYINASKKYYEYLGILTDLKDLEDIYALKPDMFDPNKDVTELLLISHVYWEMARINEMTPKLQETYQKCLSQFVKFTINQPYQIFNSEMLRRYIKQNKRRSMQINKLNQAYSQIFVQSKKCYIATFVFSESHWCLETLRNFKGKLLNNNIGIIFVRNYYKYSHAFVMKINGHKEVESLTKFLLKPPLFLLSILIKRFLQLCTYFQK